MTATAQVETQLQAQRPGAVAFDPGEAWDVDVDVFEAQGGYGVAQDQNDRDG